MTHPTETGYYVCCVPEGARGSYKYVFLVGRDSDPVDGPYVLYCGSAERIDPAACTSWSKMAPAPAGKAHQMFGTFGQKRPTKAFYFGCVDHPGHHLWQLDEVGSLRPHSGRAGPWRDGDIDGKLQPGCYQRGGYWTSSKQVQSAAKLHHLDGWTALAIWDRTVDQRGGCNSNFIFDVLVTFDEAVELARELFPRIVERIESAAKIHEPQGLG